MWVFGTWCIRKIWVHFRGLSINLSEGVMCFPQHGDPVPPPPHPKKFCHHNCRYCASGITMQPVHQECCFWSLCLLQCACLLAIYCITLYLHTALQN